MDKIKIKVADKIYLVELAETEEEREIGLQDRDNLAENEGMLFVFDNYDIVGFWMKDTKIPLDIIFIDDEMQVSKVFKGVPYSEELLEGEALYVLELNQNSGVKEGDELDFELGEEESKKLDKMLVLNSDGDVQMELEGEERIFSRAHTKVLIKFAKKAILSNKDKDYKALGKRVFKFLQVQSETAPEYVESKN